MVREGFLEEAPVSWDSKEEQAYSVSSSGVLRT